MKDAGSRDNEHDTATRGDASEFTVRPLPLGHRLGELQLDEVLGIGGFGIVYRAFDRTLRRAVAIKEYMPSMLATRGGDYTVSLRSSGSHRHSTRGAARSSTKRACSRNSTIRGSSRSCTSGKATAPRTW